MEFARKQLEKYGWIDGKGLGKNENGISDPVKAKLKHSLAGVGYDSAADFTDHWWSTLYNKAASNIEVKNKNGKTKKIRRKSKEEFEISNSTWKMKKTKKETLSDEEQYSEYFIKTAVIGEGGDKTTRVKASDSESDDEIDTKNTMNMTDEELFVACQGRTAHKGARHGLRALGKLARIEQQEKLLLQQIKYKGYTQHEKLKKNCDRDSQIAEDTNLNNEGEINTIKKRKKKIQCGSTVTSSKQGQKIKEVPNVSVDTNENEVKISRKSAKSKNKVVEIDAQAEIPEGEINRKKKKQKHHD